MFGKINFFIVLFILISTNCFGTEIKQSNLGGNFVEVKILDKVNSESTTLIIEIEKEIKFQNLIIKAKKCKNSEFDDNPEVTAYIQVQDINEKDNDKVFVFNGWTFSSSPSLRPFDHPVYDIWLTKCIN